jgi:hypothetical protein
VKEKEEKMRKALAFLMVLALAGAANAASITVSSATPDLSSYASYGGRLVTELTQYTYHVTKTTDTGDLNAFEVHVTTTEGNQKVHQVYERSYVSGKTTGYTYTETIDAVSFLYPVEGELDTGLLTTAIDLVVTSATDEDIVGLTEDTLLGSEWTGPTVGPLEVEYFDACYEGGTPAAAGRQSGYGSAYDFVGAKGTGELTDFDLFQLVIPVEYIEVESGGDIIVEIVAATATDTTREYFRYAIPEPATLSLLALGAGAALLRRKRS